MSPNTIYYNKYPLSTFYMPDVMISTSDTNMKNDRPCPQGAYNLMWKIILKRKLKSGVKSRGYDISGRVNNRCSWR